MGMCFCPHLIRRTPRVRYSVPLGSDAADPRGTVFFIHFSVSFFHLNQPICNTMRRYSCWMYLHSYYDSQLFFILSFRLSVGCTFILTMTHSREWRTEMVRRVGCTFILTMTHSRRRNISLVWPLDVPSFLLWLIALTSNPNLRYSLDVPSFLLWLIAHL